MLPVAAALILYCVFKFAYMKGGELDYVWLWILCGLPFGLHRMCLWLIPGSGFFRGWIALFALNFIIGGVIGDFVLVWRLLVPVLCAADHIPSDRWVKDFATWKCGKLPLVPMETPFTAYGKG